MTTDLVKYLQRLATKIFLRKGNQEIPQDIPVGRSVPTSGKKYPLDEETLDTIYPETKDCMSMGELLEQNIHLVNLLLRHKSHHWTALAAADMQLTSLRAINTRIMESLAKVERELDEKFATLEGEEQANASSLEEASKLYAREKSKYMGTIEEVDSTEEPVVSKSVHRVVVEFKGNIHDVERQLSETSLDVLRLLFYTNPIADDDSIVDGWTTVARKLNKLLSNQVSKVGPFKEKEVPDSTEEESSSLPDTW